MEVKFRIYKNILIALVKGEVDHHTSTSLRFAIDKAMTNFGSRDLILDFSSVKFMDSSGIGLILGRYKRMKDKPGKVYLAGCHRHIERVLRLSDVFSLIEKYETVEDAICAITGEEQLTLEVANE